MNSKTSFINPGILRHDLKGYGWIGVVYFLGLLLSVPLQIVMIHIRQVASGAIHGSVNLNPYLEVFSFNYPLQVLLWLAVPVLTGILLFRYLQSGESADLAHALPVRRETLYNTHLTAGVILLFIPVILTSLVSWAVLQGLGIEQVSGHEILIWLGVGLVFNLLLFISSATVGVLCGMSTVQGALTYILLLLPAGLTTLVLENLDYFVFGLPVDFLSNIERLSPLLRVTYNHPFTGVETVIYLICCVALYLLGLFLYRRRPSENAGNALAFRGLHPVLVYGVTFCTMLLLGAYFNSETQNSMGWTYFGYLLGSLLGYLVSLALVNKSLDIFRPIAVWNFLMYSVVIVLLITGLNYDVIGYEKRIPSLASVESVYLDGSFHRLRTARETQSPYYIEDSSSASYRRQVTMVYSDSANIAAIHELHKSIIENRGIEKTLLREYDRSIAYQHWSLAYNLKNGKTVYRQYRVPIERYVAQIKPVYESEEHKKMIYDILNISPRQVDFLQVSANEIDRSVKLTDSTLLLQAVKALQMDARSQTYEEITSHRPPWAEVTLLLNDGKRLRLSWEKSYVFFEEWLQNTGEYANARVLPNDIKYALIEKGPFADNDVQVRVTKMSHAIDADAYLRELDNSGNCVRVTDPNEIEDLLWRYTYKDDEDNRVHFVLENDTYFSAGLPQ